jgi:hypothetical protein
MSGRLLDPKDVLADLFEEFPDQFLDPVGAAKQVLDRLRDAGFAIVDAVPSAEIERLLDELAAEIERLAGAKRRALQVADERAKEANELRSQVEKLRSQSPAATDTKPIAWLITYADGQRQYRDSEPRVMPTPDSRLTPLYDRPPPIAPEAETARP